MRASPGSPSDLFTAQLGQSRDQRSPLASVEAGVCGLLRGPKVPELVVGDRPRGVWPHHFPLPGTERCHPRAVPEGSSVERLSSESRGTSQSRAGTGGLSSEQRPEVSARLFEAGFVVCLGDWSSQACGRFPAVGAVAPPLSLTRHKVPPAGDPGATTGRIAFPGSTARGQELDAQSEQVGYGSRQSGVVTTSLLSRNPLPVPRGLRLPRQFHLEFQEENPIHRLSAV